MPVPTRILFLAVALLVVGCSDDEPLRLANAEIAQGNETIASLNDQVSQTNAKLAEADAEVARRGETISSLNEEASMANAAIEELAGANAEWEREHAALTVAHDALAGDHDALVQQKAELEGDLATTESERAVVEELLAKAEKNLAILRGAAGRANTLEERAAELEEEIAELQERHRRLTDEYASLQSAYESFLEQRCASRSDEAPYGGTSGITYDLLGPSDLHHSKALRMLGVGSAEYGMVDQTMGGASGSRLRLICFAPSTAARR